MEATKLKRVVRRNLPINDKYVLIDSFYTSMENGTCCDNCNKIIANIAVIKNEATTAIVEPVDTKTIETIKKK